MKMLNEKWRGATSTENFSIALKAMKEYAQLKCAEQRSLCARAYEKSDWVEVNDCVEKILNAEEPTYE